MMPNLGQGGCQAVEDAFVLTKLLCEITDKSQIADTLQELCLGLCVCFSARTESKQTFPVRITHCLYRCRPS